MIPLLIAIPAVLAVLFQFVRNEKARGYIVYAGSGIIMLTTVIFIVRWVTGGAQTWMLYPETELIDHLMTAGDIFLMCLIIYLSVKHEKVIPIILSVLQTALVIYTEFTADVAEGPHMMVDWLTILMCVIIAFIGGFICIYTVGYMKGYHHHHKEVEDRQPFFFSMLFLFLAAMFGLVLSQNLVWIYFFWEIYAVSVPCGDVRIGPFTESGLDLFLLGDHQCDLISDDRLYEIRRSGEQQLLRVVDEPAGRSGVRGCDRADGAAPRDASAS